MAFRIIVDHEALREFCCRRGIAELALFGSVLRDDFRSDSDVDVLVTFVPGATPSLLDHADIEAELSQIFGRKVDLVSRRAIERSHNALRRKEILESAVTLNVA